jgi:hypothetical protein
MGCRAYSQLSAVNEGREDRTAVRMHSYRAWACSRQAPTDLMSVVAAQHPSMDASCGPQSTTGGSTAYQKKKRSVRSERGGFDLALRDG